MKSFFLSLLLAVLCLISSAAYSQGTYYIKPESGANLRSGPSTGSSVVTTIPHNSEVRVMSKEGDWWKVEHNGREGYIYHNTLSDQKSRSSASGSSGGSGSTANKSTSSGSSGRSSNRDSQSNRSRNSSTGSASDIQWGIGARLGDPSGITIKRYMGDRALELNVGRTHMLWYGGRWYDRRFDDWYRKRKFNYSDVKYVGYNASFPLAIQLHYLVHKNLTRASEDMSEGLLLYFGGGGQLRYQRYDYLYHYKIPGHSAWHYGGRERVTDLDLGVDGVVGLEYKFGELPISVFMDATLFMEVLDDPFLFWLQGGVGVRYNF